jgi:hypothetical protein
MRKRSHNPEADDRYHLHKINFQNTTVNTMGQLGAAKYLPLQILQYIGVIFLLPQAAPERVDHG